MNQHQESKDERWLDSSPSRFGLFRKSLHVYVVLLAVLLASWIAGYAAGEKGWVNHQQTQGSAMLAFSKDAEYDMPVYGDVLHRYKGWHDAERMRKLSQHDRLGLSCLSFVNNFAVTNTMMMIRAALIAPIVLEIPSHFSEGVSFAQSAGMGSMTSNVMLVMLGYFLTIGAMLNLSLWLLFPRRFGLPDRTIACRSGLKVLGTAWVLSAISMALASWMETESVIRIASGG